MNWRKPRWCGHIENQGSYDYDYRSIDKWGNYDYDSISWTKENYNNGTG